MNARLSSPSNSNQHFLSRWLAGLDYGLMLALLTPLFAVMPLLIHAGLPNTADGPAHLMRQVELNRAWQEGNFYPRWGADLALGHGMPIFSYAPPALYQLTQLFHLTGMPLDASMKAVLVFDFLLYSLGMFLLARSFFGAGPALVAATVYVYAPYRLREAYIQGNYGQFTGLAFYPLILWAFQRLVVVGGPRYLVLAALSLAGLLFSHNISSMLFAPLLAAYMLFLLFSPPDGSAGRPADSQPKGQLFTQRLGRVAAAALLGLGLSAIFWLPAFGERDAIKLEGITQGFFDFRENFISLPEYLSPPLPLDLAAINPEFPLSLGLPQILGGVAGILALVLVLGLTIRREPKRAGREGSEAGYALRPAIFFACFLLLYTFLALPQSAPLWEAAPLLELAEFPWRMLGPAILCASLLAAYAACMAIRWAANRPGAAPRRYLYALLAVILLFITLNGYYLYPSQFIQWGTPGPADAFAYEVTSGAIGTTSTGEFLPRAVQEFPRPDTLWPDYAAGRPPQKIDPGTLPAGARVETIERRAESETFLVDTPRAFVATIRTLYWPGWQVQLNGRPVAFTVADRTGLIEVPVPAGRHTLHLHLASTPLRSAGLWLTLLSGLILAGLGLLGLRRRPATSPVRSEPAIPARFFVSGAVILVGFYLLSRPLAPLFVLQSNPDQPLPADHVLQVDFGRSPAGPDQGLDPQGAPLLRLVGMDNFPATVRLNPAGETELDVTVYWRARQPLLTNYAVFLHLDMPDGQTAATVDEAPPENIPTRNWPPGLYLRNPLNLKISAGLPPIRYQANVGLYDRETGERLAVLPWAKEQTTYTLGYVWLVDDGPEPAASPLAHFGPDITLVGAELVPAGGNTLRLSWQAARPINRDYSIFVHLLDAEGQLLGQVDGVPFDGLYPLTHWRPGQVIEDTRLMPLPAGGAPPAGIALGIYDPATWERLPAVDSQGRSLPHNSYIIPVPSE